MLTLVRALRSPWPVLGITLLSCVALRLPFLTVPLGLDEAGFLTVAHQWRGAGSSLYTDLWVDRPPLLLLLFGAADASGGTVALRLLGAAAVLVAVLATARAAFLVAGARGAALTAVAVAGLLLNPVAGALEVNGELLAAPFVAIGVLAAIASLRAAHPRAAVAWAVALGSAATCAVLVKQNMVDPLVFGVVVAVLARVGWRRRVLVGVGTLAGAGATAAVLLGWTAALGTRLSDLWFALYPFRVEALAVIGRVPDPGATVRAQHLLVATVTSGIVAVATVLLGWGVLAVRAAVRRSAALPLGVAVAAALLATAAYDVASIALGGGFWRHYLLELAVPLGLGVGLASVRTLDLDGRGFRLVRRAAPWAAGWAATSACVALIVVALHPDSGRGTDVGRSVASVAAPRDTIVTVWGHSDVTRASGLSTPYPYLWSLPAQTLDPRTDRLGRLLTGPQAPTWFVAWEGTGKAGMDTRRLADALVDRYHLVAASRGTLVFLRDGVSRSAPRLPS